MLEKNDWDGWSTYSAYPVWHIGWSQKMLAVVVVVGGEGEEFWGAC